MIKIALYTCIWPAVNTLSVSMHTRPKKDDDDEYDDDDDGVL